MRLSLLTAACAAAVAVSATASLAQSSNEMSVPAEGSQGNFATVSTSGTTDVTKLNAPAPLLVTPDGVGSTMRIAPRRVAESQALAKAGVYVPAGYEPVWLDDRLSLTRAHQTVAGQEQMARYWEESVPRRPVPPDAGPTVLVKNSVAYVQVSSSRSTNPSKYSGVNR